MGLLTEPQLDALIAAGCTACSSPRLTFRSYVEGKLPIMGGEPVGTLVWAYVGEHFVDGVFDVKCADCKAQLFAADVCPRCHAPDALARVLATENRWPVPEACPQCTVEELRYTAFVPARVHYEGKRADKARTMTELRDPGFHGVRVDCKQCGKLDELTDRCPLCAAPAPLRQRPH